MGAWLLWFVVKLLLRVFLLLGFKTRVFGQTNVPMQGGLVLASNHQSFLDPPLLMCPLDRRGTFMARDSLFRSRLFGALIRGLNTFPVKRGGADTAAVREAVRRLKEGWCLVLFPEGTRTRDGEIGPLRPGVLSIADRAGVPIVPAVIEGAFQAWPRNGGIRRHPISVWYGRPISVEARKKLGRLELAEALRAKMCAGRAALKKMQACAKYGKKKPSA